MFVAGAGAGEGAEVFVASFCSPVPEAVDGSLLVDVCCCCCFGFGPKVLLAFLGTLGGGSSPLVWRKRLSCLSWIGFDLLSKGRLVLLSWFRR